MIKSNKNNKSGKFDPNGNYTGKYVKEVGESDVTVLTAPEQDVDDL